MTLFEIFQVICMVVLGIAAVPALMFAFIIGLLLIVGIICLIVFGLMILYFKIFH